MGRRAAILILLFVLAGFGAWFARAPEAKAQETMSVLSEQAENDYPQGVTFKISVNLPASVDEARLLYELAPDGTGATAVAECTGTTTVSCVFQLVSGRGIFIIPGAEITYHWEISDTAGHQLSTPPKLYTHQDTRFTFATLARDNVTVYYHAGSDTAARLVLDAAVDTLQKAGQLENTQVTFPVKVFLYTTAEEMQPSIAAGGEGRGVVILGEVVYSDTAMVSADVATLDITRHEVAHIVTGQATKGPFGVPAWLNEGTSVYAQAQVLDSHASALASAIRSNTVLTMPQLNSVSTGAASDTVSLYYGEAGSIVKFLVDTYGAANFAELLKTFKEGSTPDKAFQTVYGFDALGLENNWRQSVGLEPRTASATPTPRPTEEARAAPTSAGAPAPSSANDSSDGVGAVAIALIAAMALLVAGAAVAVFATVRRRI